MPLRVFNYLTRDFDRFRPQSPQRVAQEQVRVHVCGPSLRDHAHLGHARTYVVMDVVLRHLRECGYHVHHVRSHGDLGHRGEAGMHRRVGAETLHDGRGPFEAVEGLIRSFEDDMDRLGVVRPNITPRATCHIPDIIAWIETLLDLDYAYEADGPVYCSVGRLPSYGELSRAVLGVGGEEAASGAASGARPDDFPLWKPADPSDPMTWPSPWGRGVPSWPLSCSVMTAKHLGPSFEIHGGEVDDSVTHLDQQLALSEAYHRVAPVQVWLLVGTLRVNGRKMTHRLGNFLTIKDALRLYSPEAIRLFVLSEHYRGPMEFSREALQVAQRSANRLHRTGRLLQRRMREALPLNGAGTAALSNVSSLEAYRARFRAAMDDDFNTPDALGVIFDLMDEVNRTLEQGPEGISLGTLSAMDKLLRDLAGGVLGLLPSEPGALVGEDLVVDLVETLLTLRAQRREAKDWAGADQISNRLDQLGISVLDGPFDTTWRLRE